MDILDEQKRQAEWIMREYDRLPAELRAAVQEYGELPWTLALDVNEYIASQEYMRQLNQKFMFEQAGV